MNKLLAATFLMIISSIFVFAQNTDDHNENEFFVGFTHQVFDTGGTTRLNGFEAAYTRNISRYFGIKGDVSATFRRQDRTSTTPEPNPSTISSRNRDSITNFLVGVQVKDNASKKRFKPFAHALAGVGRVSRELNVTCTGNCQPQDGINVVNKDTAFSGAFGGGLDIKLSKKIDLRAIQIDYNPIFTSRYRSDTVRLSIGIVFK